MKFTKNSDLSVTTGLPGEARMPVNHCNLPAVILGSLTFQLHPAPLTIDSTRVLYRDLFRRLRALDSLPHRIDCFHDYMQLQFQLHDPQQAGFDPAARLDRSNASYRRLLRGWFFDSDGRDAAVLRGWVESRFGLLPRYHRGLISDGDCDNYRRYLHMRTEGLYNTNALESQLDVLYTWCQYELRRRHARPHLRLYRGINRFAEQDVLQREGDEYIMVLNNLSSFSADSERAGELGTYVIEADIPREKILLYPEIATGMLDSEREYLVIGGVCRVKRLNLPLL